VRVTTLSSLRKISSTCQRDQTINPVVDFPAIFAGQKTTVYLANVSRHVVGSVENFLHHFDGRADKKLADVCLPPL